MKRCCRVSEYGKKQTGLDQYAIQKYAEAFEIIPRTLAENSGLNATDIIANLYAAHASGQSKAGQSAEEWAQAAALMAHGRSLVDLALPQIMHLRPTCLTILCVT